MIITPGVRHLQRESRQGPSTTAECEQSIQIACYNPVQIQQAFHQGGRTRTARGFSARSGYNLAVGLGTVNARYFVTELARQRR